METITICVTEEDIKNGKRRSAALCPISLAARRAFFTNKLTTYMTLKLYDDNRKSIAEYELPARARRFVIDYDAERRVYPFTFTISGQNPREVPS